MEVAPVDAKVVAGAVEDFLVLRAGGEDVEGCGLIAEGVDLLAAVVDGDDWVYVEENGDLMWCGVGGFSSPGKATVNKRGAPCRGTQSKEGAAARRTTPTTTPLSFGAHVTPLAVWFGSVSNTRVDPEWRSSTMMSV